MKKIILLFVFFIAFQGFSQTNGISYQAIIMNPKGEQLPGVNNANSPVVNKDICMVFKFIDEFSNIEYQETQQIKTDGFGMVNLVIGKGTQTAGYAASFQSIVWNSSKKSLIVGISTNGNCATYTEISNQEFSYAPLAFSAISAENVTGVVAIENGGTNATSVLGARTNLQINNVDNTSDLNKPLSTATQTALSLKENLANKSTNVTTDGTSDTKYPSVKSVKNYIDASTASATTALTNEISRATTAENTIAANLVTETNNRTAANNTLTTNLATEVTNRTAADNTLTTNLTAETTARTSADATLTTNLATEVTNRTAANNTLTTNLSTEIAARTSADATLTTNLATEVTNRTAADLLKEDVANKSTNVTTDGASDIKYPSVKSVKTYVDASANTASTALANEVSRATAAENTIAANLVTETNNRTTANNTLTTNLSTEIAARASADGILQTNINTVQADVDANEAAANTALNLKAPLASPTFTGTVSGIDKTMVGLGNIDNTTDASKPVSLATQTALNFKVDKVSGKGLSTEDYTTAEKTKLAAITGTNTGDQDISEIAVNATKIGDLTSLTTTAKSNLVAAVNEIQAGKASLVSPTFTGTVSGITKSMVGLGNVDDTSDLGKPVSTATQTALNLKANLASPTFTGTVSGIDKTMVGLGNVDNTTDASKPVSSATQTALNLKVDKVPGKGLSTEDYTTAEKTKLAAITGTNTGDQDISGIAVNATKIGDLTNLTTTAQSNLVAAVNEIEAGKANLDSPTLIGIPLAPTATAGTNTTQIATTEFVTTAISSANIPDASTTVKGKIQLAGDLTGTAISPIIANDAITSPKIADGTIANSDISSSAGITYSKLTLTNSIQNVDLVANSITTSKVANGTVTTSKMADQAISSLKILDGTILNADIDPAAAIAYSKLNLVGSVASTDIIDGAITSAKIATSPSFTGTPLAPTATAGTNTTQIATTAFVIEAITTSSTPDASTTEKGKIQLAGDLSGTATLPTITNDAVTSTKIADGTILNADISSSAGITYSKLTLTNSIQNVDLVANSITTSKVANGTVTTSKMADQAISSLKILDGTILNADIDPAAAIAYSKLNLVGSVASTDIIDGAITSAKITTSPSFTGTPLAPTATAGTNTTQIATTAFVKNAVSNAIVEVADEFTATASQTSFALTQTPSTNSKVKMYINGIRISKTAYSVSGTTLTYNAANNGSYSLSVGDRIQFDYFY